MQLARDERVILDLDKIVEANHTSILCEHHAPLYQQRVNRLAVLEKYNSTPLLEEETNHNTIWEFGTSVL